MDRIYINTDNLTSDELSILSIYGMINGDDENPDMWYTDIPDFAKIASTIGKDYLIYHNKELDRDELCFVRN